MQVFGHVTFSRGAHGWAPLIGDSVGIRRMSGAIEPRIDNWAHLGGLLGGAVIAHGVQPRMAWRGS